MRSRGRVFGVSICCSPLVGLFRYSRQFKFSFSLVKMVIVNQLAFLCLEFERKLESPRAQECQRKNIRKAVESTRMVRTRMT